MTPRTWKPRDTSQRFERLCLNLTTEDKWMTGQMAYQTTLPRKQNKIPK